LATLYFLLEERHACLPWNKAFLSLFVKLGKKEMVTIKFIYHWREAVLIKNNEFVVIFGNDTEWLEQMLCHLMKLQLRIIMVDGVIARRYSNVCHVVFDQEIYVQSSLNLLRSYGRTRTAFFGGEKNDPSDERKEENFRQWMSSSDIYTYTGNIDLCFEAFLKQIERYDSVMCANDLAAVYLIKRCYEHGILIPEQLYLVGQGNLWIGDHVTPGLTTYAHDKRLAVLIILQMCKQWGSFSDWRAVDIVIKPELIERETTGHIQGKTRDGMYKRNDQYMLEMVKYDNTKYGESPEIRRILELDAVLSTMSVEELQILQMLTMGETYEAISLQLTMSEDSVKYHIKKIYRLMGIHSRGELTAIAQEYQIRFFSTYQ